ncbi:MAG: hypothetical protein ACRD3L_01470 [Terriglobales bacterium]
MTVSHLQAAQRLLSNRRHALAMLTRISAEGGEATPLQREELSWLAGEAGEYEIELATAHDDPVAELERLYSLED